jgi:hypothetical protein
MKNLILDIIAEYGYKIISTIIIILFVLSCLGEWI